MSLGSFTLRPILIAFTEALLRNPMLRAVELKEHRNHLIQSFHFTEQRPRNWEEIAQKADGEFWAILGLECNVSSFLFLIYCSFHISPFPEKGMSSKSVYRSCWVNSEVRGKVDHCCIEGTSRNCLTFLEG